MTGHKYILSNLHISSQNSVIFGEAAKGRIIGTCSLIIPGLYRLKDVLLVEGLTVNLVSISQLFDEDLLVQFTKDKCIVHNQNHYRIIEGKRTLDNYYLLTNTSFYMNEIQ